jgi:hypothetical protein
MKTILISTFIILATPSIGQTIDKFEPFNRTDYPSEIYQITSDSVKFKNYIIDIRQVKSILSRNQFYCRAWLTISNKNKFIFRRFFKSIEPVGACYGLFIPLEQPRKDYFILTKLGDYDGRIIIIDSSGNITEKIGGEFYVSADKRYLFSGYHSDQSGLTVFDLNKGQCIFSDTITPYLDEWYYKDNKYISRIDLFINQISAYNYYYFDLVTNKLIYLKQDKDYLKPENRLQSYNDKNNRRFCNCGF